MTSKVYPLPPEPGAALMLCPVASMSTLWLLEALAKNLPRFPTAVLCLHPRVPAVVQLLLLMNARVVTARERIPTKAEVGAQVRVPTAVAEVRVKARVSILVEVTTGARVPLKMKIGARVTLPTKVEIRIRMRVFHLEEIGATVAKVGAEATVLTMSEVGARAREPVIKEVGVEVGVTAVTDIMVGARAPAIARNDDQSERVLTKPKIQARAKFGQ